MIVFGVIGGVVVFGILMGIVGTEILEGPAPKQNTYTTIVLREVDGEVKAVGLSGVSGTNPTIVMRSSPDYQMNLRVINQDQEAHRLVTDGYGASTNILQGDDVDDTILLSGGTEGTYTYRCALHEDEIFGELRVVEVTALG